MNFGRWIVDASVRRYILVTVATVAVTVAVMFFAAVPSIKPGLIPFLKPVQVDTDPENMLSPEEPVRAFNSEMKKEMSLHDMVVVGVVNDINPDGVFNVDSLRRIYQLTNYAETLKWREDDGKWGGVVEVDLIAPSTVDSIEPGDVGEVKFEWLMRTPPATQAAALDVRRKAERIPFLNDTLVSGDGRAIALYLPLTRKDLSHRVYSALNDRMPMLWLWAPLEARIGESGMSNQSRDAMTVAGRLLAWYAPDKDSFEEALSQVASQAAGGDAAAKGFAAAAADAGAAKAALASGASSESEEGSSYAQAVDAWHQTTSAKATSDVYYRILTYYLESRKAASLSADELLGQAGEFARTLSAGFADKAEFAAMPGVISAVTEQYGAFPGPDRFYITGLPVAEDTFGVEMFVQMAISAPVAMLVIFILMLIFFRKLVLIISPLLVAMISVIITMGALVIAGYPIHIMSSMIPIFIMPIAVLDSIHVISELFERYQETRDHRKTIVAVMNTLFVPMLYTSLTSAAGFASLALTPIPPVQVFGIFVSIGIMVAWLLTVTFIPAFVMFIPAKLLENFGTPYVGKDHHEKSTPLGRFLEWVGSATYRRAKPIVALVVVVLIISVVGISMITVNDNPVKWFTSSHPIREADRVMNAHFGGTYMAYLGLSAKEGAYEAEAVAAAFAEAAAARAESVAPSFSKDAPVGDVFKDVAEKGAALAGEVKSRGEFLDALTDYITQKASEAQGEEAFVWNEAETFVAEERAAALEVFKDPEVLAYISQLQRVMKDTEIVGKSNSLSDIVKTVYRELVSSAGEDQAANFRIPATQRMVAETLMQFQNSHRPGDLWHFVTPDYRKTSIWVQLKSGDNRDMSAVKAAVDAYVANYPPPVPLEDEWFGLTYINVVWQAKMVYGMLQAFSGSFLVVFLLMAILFRSVLWGLLSMIPLSVTILAIYGAIGLLGKDYDMPVAVLSSLTLGMAVDFAIHFLARTRKMYPEHGTWELTAPAVFGEPARAIARNIIVIAAGFMPLLLAPLVPYKTVGALLAIILLVSGMATLLLLPALMRLFEKSLFKGFKEAMGPACNCTLCIVSAATLVVVIALNLHQYAEIGWSRLTLLSIVAIPVLAAICGIVSRREKCKLRPETENKEENHVQ